MVRKYLNIMHTNIAFDSDIHKESKKKSFVQK